MSNATLPRAPRPRRRPAGRANGGDKQPDPILFQTYFKSVGPRTYAAQMKRASNGNHYLVFTEGKRDKETNEVRKTSLFVFSEDFVSFFKMLKETAEFVRGHPVPADVVERRQKFWQREKSAPQAGRE
jgi:hypothetical protein